MLKPPWIFEMMRMVEKMQMITWKQPYNLHIDNIYSDIAE